MTTPTLQTHDILLSDSTTTLGLMCVRDKNGKLTLKRGFRPSFADQQFTDVAPSAFKLEDQLFWRQNDWGGAFGIQIDTAKKYQDTTGVDASFPNLLCPGPVPVASTKTTPTYASTATIANGGFEAGDLSSWTIVTEGSVAWAAQNGTVQAGSWAAGVSVTTAGTAEIKQQVVAADCSLFNTLQITVSVYGRKVAAAGNVTLQLLLKDASGTTIASTSATAMDSAAWTQLTINHTFTEGWPNLYVHCKFAYVSSVETACYLDTTVVTPTGAVATAADMGTVKGMVDFNAAHYAYSETGLWKRAAANWVRVVGSPDNIVHAASDGTDLYLARGATLNFWYMSTAEVFTRVPGTGDQSQAIFFRNVAGVMYGVSTNSQLYKYDDITVPSGTATYTIAQPGYNATALVDYNATYAVVMKENSAFYVTTAAASGAMSEFINALNSVYNANTGKQSIMWNAILYIPNGTQGVYEYATASSEVGPATYAQRLASFSGQVVALAGDERWLFAFVDNGAKIEIMKGHRETVPGTTPETDFRWHPFVQDTYATVAYAHVTSITAKRLWYGGGTALPKYIPLPTTYGNPLSDTNLTFQTGVTYRTGWIDGGLPDDMKTWKSCTIDSLSLSTGAQTVKVEYKKLGDAAFTELGGSGNGTFGTAATGTQEKFFETGTSAVKSKRIQLQLTFTSNDTAVGFGVTGIRLYAVTNPARLGEVQATVMVKQYNTDRRGNEDKDMTHAVVVSTLMGWAATHPLTLTLPDPSGAVPGGVTMEVKIADSFPRQTWLATDPNHPDRLESAIELVFVESRTS